MLEKEGRGYVLASVGQESGEIPYTAYFAKKSYIDTNKEVIQKFTEALYKGQKWVDSHTPKEIAEAIKSSFPDTDLAILETVARRYQDIDAWCKNPVMKESSFELLQTVMDKAGRLKQKTPFDKVVDTTYAEKSMK